MKNLLCFLLLLCVTGFAQTSQKLHYLKITQNECVKKKGYRLQLKSVSSDSRCPEGVNCIWAGEAQIVVSVYRDKKFIEDHTLVVSSKNKDENCDWFSRYTGKKVTRVQLLPYPKEGNPVSAKDYFLKIGFVK